MKISKQQKATIEDLRSRYAAALTEASDAQDEANVAIEESVKKLNEKIGELNAIIAEANSLREEIADAAQSYIDDKSEKWQEGDRGQAFSEWQGQWSNEIDEIEEAEVELIGLLGDAPEELLSEWEYPGEPG